MPKQRYILSLLVYDCENKEIMRSVVLESTMLDEIVSTLRSAEIDLLKIQQERDKDRYKKVYEKPKK